VSLVLQTPVKQCLQTGLINSALRCSLGRAEQQFGTLSNLLTGSSIFRFFSTAGTEELVPLVMRYLNQITYYAKLVAIRIPAEHPLQLKGQFWDPG
jgi:hypothetical protein